MTAFLSPGTIGGKAPSTDTRALQEINSRKKSFANKDFTKNMAYLNNSVDTLSQWSQKLQAGVDQANENIFEQITGFAGDLFVVFAGLEPTGIDLGDLKYVLQGIGSLLGINPNTPFPMNLIDAALHMFSTYIVPLDQFTDVIFDAIFAWAEDLGFSPEFIQSMRDLLSAIEALGATFYDLFDSLSDLLGAFGFLNFTSTSGLGDIWDSVLDIITVITTPLKPVLSILADLGIPFIQALTGIVQGINSFLTPLSFISGGQVTELGDNIIPKVSNDTTIWGVSASNTSGWTYDGTQSADQKTLGSFTTLGNSTGKTMVSQAIFPCKPDQKFAVDAMLKWIGIPSGSNDFGVALIWFNDANQVSQSNLSISPGHGSSGGWTGITGNFTVPQNVNGFKMAVRVGTTITSGQVWVDNMSARLQGLVEMNLISGLISAINGLLPWNFFDTILGTSANGDNLFSFFTNLLNPSSPISVFNLFGILPPWTLPGLPLGNLTDQTPELLIAPTFDTQDVIQLGQNWAWDGTTGRNTNGAARVQGSSIPREMVSNKIPVKAGDTIAFSTWYKWQQAVYGGTDHIVLGIVGYVEDQYYGYNNIQSKTMDGYSNPTWQQLSGNFTIPDTVTHVALQLRLASTVSSGYVWFDDCSMKRTNNYLPQSWILNLIPDIGGIRDIAYGIIGAIRTVITGIPFVGGTLAQLFDALTGWHQDTQAAAAQASDAFLGVKATNNAIVAGLTSTPSTAATEVEVQAAATALTGNVTTVQTSADTLSTIVSTPRVVPSYVAYGTDDVCFHHTLIDGTSVPALGQLVLCPIRVTQDRIYEAIKFGIAATTMTNLYIALFRCDQSNGNLTQILDLGDCKSYLDTAYNQQIVPLPLSISVTAGDLYYVGFLQVGGVAAGMFRTSSNASWTTGLYPRWVGNIYNTTGLTAIPTSIAGTDVSSGNKYYAAMGDISSIVVPPNKFYSDSFNRANGDLGPGWTARAGNAWQIDTNMAVPNPGFLAGAGWSSYNQRAGSLSQRVKMRPTNVTHNATSAATNSGYSNNFRFGLRGDGLGRSVIAELFLNTPANAGARSCTARIRTATSYSDCLNGGVQRASSASGAAGYFTDQNLEFVCSGSLYQIVRNGLVIASWDDSAGVYAVDSSCTEQGFGGAGGSNNRMCFDDWEGGDF